MIGGRGGKASKKYIRAKMKKKVKRKVLASDLKSY
jgi:hypothetical protein